ncbi:MAG TPA: hypothetical protein VIW03_18320 [Anaeromyxobacter sp.]
MLSPWGRAAPRVRCAIDRWTGAGWRLVERHEIAAPGPPAAALAALASVPLRELPAVRALFALRGLRFSAGMTLRDFFSTPPFVLLEEDRGRELVFGILVPPRDGAGRRRAPATPAEHRAALPRAPLAATGSFGAEAKGTTSLLWTETWVRTNGRLAASAFGAYWLAIGPFSAWIRRMFLRAGRRRADLAARHGA